MLTFRIGGDLMTVDQYMEREGVSYLRAIHEINTIVNRSAADGARSHADPEFPGFESGRDHHDEPKRRP
jgi:hypothetical protein